MTSALKTAFTPTALRSLAYGRSFERGAAYADEGRVKRLKIGDQEVTAIVRGARAYQVRLWLEGGVPEFSCTCPVAADGLFCKHCVAVGLALSRGDPQTLGAGGPPAATDLRACLAALDKHRLVDLILVQAENDELLRGRLELEAAKTRGAHVDLDGYRHAIRDVMNPGDFIDYRSMYDYSRGIADLIGSLEELADDHADELIELSEHALACLEDAQGSVDDSDGYMGDIKERLSDLHHTACIKARPDPVALAERLFDWELHSDWEIFYRGAATYADVLGEAGLAAYRRRAEEVWAHMPAIAAGEREQHSTFRFNITSIMETLAELSADVDQLVAVRARDLSSAYAFVQIAELLRAAGRHDEALTWAKRGVAAYPERTDVRLREILADEYERRGRREDALALMWLNLTERPTLDAYQRLKAHAGPGGLWTAWRTKALGVLREPSAEADANAPASLGWGRKADRSALIKALLWEGDVDAAWEEAIAGGCSDSLWMELATRREASHPADVLPIYRKQVERQIALKNNRAYAEAVVLIRKIGDLMEQLDRGDELPEYLASIRIAHKRKRNLMMFLDQSER